MGANLGSTLILLGVLIVIVGLVLNLAQRFGLPHLPDDILIKRDGFTLYFPIVTSIVISLIITIIFNLFK